MNKKGILRFPFFSIAWHIQRMSLHRSLTPRMVRREVELRFSLSPGTLDSEEHKGYLKRAIESAIASLDEEVDDFPKGKTSTKKRSGAEELPKNTKLAGKTIESNHRRTVKRKRDGHASEYKSVAIITSSDAEEEPESTSQGGPHRKGLEDSVVEELHDRHDSSPYQRQKAAQVDDGQIQGTAAKIVENKSEFKISTLVDETPRRRKKARTTDQETRGKSGQAKKATCLELSCCDYQSLVAACGKLREILAEMGMTGRYSLEQAKRIKEKRELAKELEDVQSFQQSVIDRAFTGRKTSRPDNLKIELSDADEAEDVAMPPMQQKRTALQSIRAFLEDQGDDE
ncbi:hypothetical protein L208DRAFT_377877 [Tricholoma matsutake]|nr:hypothetical protein L208DRAFT_377877 [Tricholoma matsutake 945]